MESSWKKRRRRRFSHFTESSDQHGMASLEVDVGLSGFALTHFAVVTSPLQLDWSTSMVIHASIRPALIILSSIYHVYGLRQRT